MFSLFHILLEIIEIMLLFDPIIGDCPAWTMGAIIDQGLGTWTLDLQIPAGALILQRQLFLKKRSCDDDIPTTPAKPFHFCVRFAKVPLADWIPRQGKDSHDALTKLTDEINQQLGRRSVNRASDDSQQAALNVDHY